MTFTRASSVMEIAVGKKRPAMKAAIRRAILSAIRRKAPLSRRDIIDLTHIRPSTVSDITDAIIRDGIIRETGRLDTAAGRKPILLELNTESRIALGLHYSGNLARIVAVNLLGKVKFQTHKLIRMSGRASFMADTLATIAEAVGIMGKSLKHMMGVGLGVPGLVDRQRGMALYHTGYGWWQNLPLKQTIEDKFGIPAFVENDTKTLTMAERWFGCGKGVRHMIYIDIGEGVAAGLVLDGKIYSGANGIAGELGHTVVDSSGPPCNCGRRGCLETVFSGKAKKLARNSKPRPKALLDRMSQYLSITAVNLANLFNPEMIVLGGTKSAAFGEWLLKDVSQAVRTQALKTAAPGMRIMLSQLGEYSGALGAASMALESWFDLE